METALRMVRRIPTVKVAVPKIAFGYPTGTTLGVHYRVYLGRIGNTA